MWKSVPSQPSLLALKINWVFMQEWPLSMMNCWSIILFSYRVTMVESLNCNPYSLSYLICCLSSSFIPDIYVWNLLLSCISRYSAFCSALWTLFVISVANFECYDWSSFAMSIMEKASNSCLRVSIVVNCWMFKSTIFMSSVKFFCRVFTWSLKSPRITVWGFSDYGSLRQFMVTSIFLSLRLEKVEICASSSLKTLVISTLGRMLW